MTGSRVADVVVYALLIILPLSALVARRPPLGQAIMAVLAWIGIFAIGLALVGQRDRLTGFLGGQSVEGRETRIPMAADGHFWIDATIGGTTRRMLIDSGATTTAISQATAQAAGIDLSAPFPVILNTANGRVSAKPATIGRFVVGSVTARDLGVVVSPAFGDVDIIGMNFLSRLASWRVEGRALVLTPVPPVKDR